MIQCQVRYWSDIQLTTVNKESCVGYSYLPPLARLTRDPTTSPPYYNNTYHSHCPLQVRIRCVSCRNLIIVCSCPGTVSHVPVCTSKKTKNKYMNMAMEKNTLQIHIVLYSYTLQTSIPAQRLYDTGTVQCRNFGYQVKGKTKLAFIAFMNAASPTGVRQVSGT